MVPRLANTQSSLMKRCTGVDRQPPDKDPGPNAEVSPKWFVSRKSMICPNLPERRHVVFSGARKKYRENASHKCPSCRFFFRVQFIIKFVEQDDDRFGSTRRIQGPRRKALDFRHTVVFRQHDFFFLIVKIGPTRIGDMIVFDFFLREYLTVVLYPILVGENNWFSCPVAQRKNIAVSTPTRMHRNHRSRGRKNLSRRMGKKMTFSEIRDLLVVSVLDQYFLVCKGASRSCRILLPKRCFATSEKQ